VYMVGNNRVELRVSGVGLKVVNPKTNRTLLDRGADLIWESADFCDVGRITITEIRTRKDPSRNQEARSK